MPGFNYPDIDEMHIEPLFIRAFERRLALFADPDTNCFRLFNSDGDGFAGISVDLYGEYILIQYFSPHLSAHTPEIVRALERSAAALSVNYRGILLKQRVSPVRSKDLRAQRESILVDGSLPPTGYVVKQNGIAAVADLVRGQSTGIFLDMREIREMLARYYRPSDSMLNLFCYTALFSVHALKNGTAAAINVDLSKAVLARAKENYALNGLHVDERDFVYGDAIDWLRRFKKKGKNFSFVIFDPPTFSRNRWRTFSLKKDYRDSLLLVDSLVESGHVLTSVNSYSVSVDQYRSFHPSTWRLEMFNNESSDFPHTGTPYLKTGLWKIKIS